MTFQNTAQMVALILSVGLYATLLTGDIVFSDQYKNNTLKNEVSYGVPRVRIYLGKLIVAILVAIVAERLTSRSCRYWPTVWQGPSPCGWGPRAW